ncbi:MAG: methylated-DNA--[protein]-cysteine S-methyltransferase [Chloroflexi bacterium]|nr:methylated-DNA--[protein]-cysteine S-methyltransferase [Chloroflexota bacterium]
MNDRPDFSTLIREALDVDAPPPPRAAYWTTMESPVGELHLASDDTGRVRGINFRTSTGRFLDWLASAGWIPLREHDPNQQLVAELEEYFAGKRRAFDVAVDLSSVNLFTRMVLEETSRIQPGAWATYGEVAERIGHPRAARAVGNALGANPVPIVIPCHRVLAVGGRIGGYARSLPEGLAIKRHLLRTDGVTRIP